MASFISLINFTELGGTHMKESPQRAATFKASAAALGVTVKEVYWTLGAYDGVVVLEAPDDAAATAALLALGALGNVRTHTLRAFTAAEMGPILAKAFAAK